MTFLNILRFLRVVTWITILGLIVVWIAIDNSFVLCDQTNNFYWFQNEASAPTSQTTQEEANLSKCSLSLEPVVAFATFAFLELLNLAVTRFTPERRAGNRDFLDEHNRSLIRSRVQSYWVNQFLDDSLGGSPLMKLSKRIDPNQVEYPLDILAGKKSRRREQYSSVDIGEIFQKYDKSLLVLGDGGTGKTTIMLNLLKWILNDNHYMRAVPIVLPLSRWNDSFDNLRSWIQSEMRVYYHVSSKISKFWFEQHELILMLDGLDDVQKEVRSKCVLEINKFLKSERPMGLVVTCRSDTYASLSSKLRAANAIELQRLEPTQVLEFFEGAGDQYEAALHLLKRNAELRSIVTTPLMVNILAVTYEGFRESDVEEIPELGQTELLLEQYSERVINDQSTLKKYRAKNVRQWFQTLATRMTEQESRHFFLEDIQPSWLTGWRLFAYSISVWMILGGLVGLTIIAVLTTQRRLNLLLQVNDTVIGQAFSFPSSVILIVSTVLGILYGIRRYILNHDDEVHTIEILNWSVIDSIQAYLSSEAANTKGKFINGIGWGVALGFFGMSNLGDFSAFPFGFFQGFLGYTVLARASGIYEAINNGVNPSLFDQTSSVNQGITSSFRNCLKLGFVSCVVVTLAYAFTFICYNFTLFGFRLGTEISLLRGLRFGLMAGFAAAMHYGGIAVIKHYATRVWLTFEPNFPNQLLQFMEDGVTGLVMSKAGGSYRFIHPTLHDYFSSVYWDDSDT